MTNTRRTSAAVVIVTAAIISLSACDSGPNTTDTDCVPAHDVSTISPGSLTVSAHVYPPFSDFDGDKLTGFEGDLIAEVAAMECLAVVPMQLPTASVVSAVTTGRADTAIGMWYRTSARAEIVTLGEPVVSDSMAIVSRPDVAIESIADMKGKKVGHVLGYLWDDDLKSYLGSDLTSYADLQSAYADFQAGRIDVLVDTAPSAAYRLAGADIEADVLIPEPDPAIAASLAPGQSQFMSSLDNAELAEAMSADVEQLRADGTIAELLEKWDLPESIGEPGEPTLL